MKPYFSGLLLAVSFAAVASVMAAPLLVVEKGGGTQFGTKTTQALAFHGAAPVAQRAGSAQAAVTSTVGAAVVTTAATTTTPAGFTTTAQADALVARVNQLRVDVLALTALCNEQRAALVEKGLIKGAP